MGRWTDELQCGQMGRWINELVGEWMEGRMDKILKTCFQEYKFWLGPQNIREEKGFIDSGLGLGRWNLERQKGKMQGNLVYIGTVSMSSAVHSARYGC